MSPAHVVHLGVGDGAELYASAVGAAHTAFLPTEEKIEVNISTKLFFFDYATTLAYKLVPNLEQTLLP